MPIYKTNRRKDGKQQYRVIINYTDSNGVYRKKEQIAYGYEAAHELEHHMQLKYCQSMGSLGQLAFTDFFEEYIEYKKHENRETTIAKAVEITRNHIIPYLGNIVMADITPQMIMEWKKEINRTSLSITTKRNCYTQLCAILNFALKMDAIHENPTFKVGNFRDANFKMPEEKIQYYTSEDFICFITTARASIDSFFQWCIWVFFCIAYFTGMRKGEIHALKWSDVDAELIHVRRSISQKVSGKKYVEAPPKNKSSFRKLQIPEPLNVILQQHKERQQNEFPAWNEDFRVCGGDRCLSDTSIANYNHRWAEAAGLKTLRIHDYRHSHATLLANEGINIQEVARRLGHSNVKMTMDRYAHLYPREEERAVLVLNRIQF